MNGKARSTFERRAERANSLRLLVVLAALGLIALAWWTSVSDLQSVAAILRDAPTPPPETARPTVTAPGSDATEDRAALAVDRRLRVRVGYADGTPAPQARLVLHDARAALDETRTDESGRATLRCTPAALERELWIAVAGAGFGVHDEPLAPHAEVAAEIPIVFPHAGRIAGRVTVKGLAPESEVEIALDGVELRPASLPRSVWDRLRGAGLPADLPWQVARVRAGEGIFEFRGIPEGIEGSLRPAGEYVLRVQADAIRGGSGPPRDVPSPPSHEIRGSIAIAGPLEGMHLDLVPFSVVRGRAIRADGSAVAGALVRRIADIHLSYSVASSEGDFALSLHPPKDDTSVLEIEAWSPDRAEAGTIASSGFDCFDSPAGIGDVVLHPIDARRLLVRERDGAPIGGARVWWKAYRYESTLTDAEGMTTMLVPKETTRAPLYVVADGYRAATRSPSTTLVELYRETRLVVVAREASGRVLEAPDWWLEVASTRELFDAGWEMLNDFGSESLAIVASPEGGITSHLVAVRSPSSTTVRGIRTGVPLRIRLFDPTGRIAAEQNVDSSPVGELRIELAADRPSRTLQGVVLDPEGVPLRGATVHAIVDVAARLVTDRQGRFRVETTASSLGLLVQAASCANLRLASVDPADSPLEIRMEQR